MINVIVDTLREIIEIPNYFFILRQGLSKLYHIQSIVQFLKDLIYIDEIFS